MPHRWLLEIIPLAVTDRDASDLALFGSECDQALSKFVADGTKVLRTVRRGGIRSREIKDRSTVDSIRC